MQIFKEIYFTIHAHSYSLQDYKSVDIYMQRTIATLGISMSTWGNGDGSHFYPQVNERISQELLGELAFSK